MADSELGELRRPHRPVEHRLERLARWRAQGLAGGTSDSVFPADATDDVMAADGDADGDGGDPPTWFADSFNLTSATTSPLTLTHYPLYRSEVVRLNGVTLEPDVDYTIDGISLAFVDLADLLLGIGSDTWDLVASYAYVDTVDATPEITFVVAGVASIAGITHELTDDEACILFVPGNVTDVDGYAATWTKVYDGGSTREEVDVWVGTGIGSGDTITRSVPFGVIGGMVLAVVGAVGGAAPTITALQATAVSSGGFSDPHVISGSAPVDKLLAVVIRPDTMGEVDVFSTWTIAGLLDASGDGAAGGGIYNNGMAVAVGVQDDSGSFSVTFPMVAYSGAGSTYVFQIEAT